MGILAIEMAKYGVYDDGEVPRVRHGAKEDSVNVRMIVA